MGVVAKIGLSDYRTVILPRRLIKDRTHIIFYSYFTVQAYERKFNIFTNRATLLDVSSASIFQDLVNSLLIGRFKK